MIENFNTEVLQPLTFSVMYIGVCLAAIGAGAGVLRWGLGLS